jgi:hypothetical protein
MDVAEFLGARLDEEEQLARESHSILLLIGNDSRVLVDGSDERNTYRFIEKFNPQRVLREIAAKRKIVEDWLMYRDAEFPDFEGGWSSACDSAARALAEIYLEHPDFDAIDWEK